MKMYLPIAKIDAAQRMVYGYASTEARDDQGEIVKREALEGALGDYMKFGNIREMHQLSAVGKAKNAEIDEKGLYLGAKVVDDSAWEKVVEGVYNGFSIGGKVLEREAGDYKTINKLRLDEISLVDRPANPEAVFDCWKRAALEAERSADPLAALKAAIERVEALVKADGKGDKPYGDVAYADPGYQEDKKQRYPIGTEAHIRAAWNYINKPKNADKYSSEEVSRIKAKIISAWKDKIDPKGPPSADDGEKAAHAAMQKHLGDVGFVASIILELDRLKEMLAMEALVEGDDSPQSERLGAIVDELCGFLNALVAEETAEIESDEEMDLDDGVAMSAIATSLRKSGLTGRAKAFDDYALKARHSAADQALLDVAYGATLKAHDMDGIGAGDKVHCAAACDAMKAAGATEHSTQDTANNPTYPAPQATPPAQEYRPGAYTTVNTAKAVLELIEAALGKRSAVHKALMCVAHDCLGKMTDGKTCAMDADADDAGKAGGRHSKETFARLKGAHDHLVSAGAKCDAAGEQDRGQAPAPADDDVEEEEQGTKESAAQSVDLQKRYDALAQSVADLTPRLDAIMKTVERIDKTPLPPLTRSTAGLTRVEKGGAEPAESDEALMARVAAMTPDQQAMLLIKAARLRPYRLGPGGAQLTDSGNG